MLSTDGKIILRFVTLITVVFIPLCLSVSSVDGHNGPNGGAITGAADHRGIPAWADTDLPRTVQVSPPPPEGPVEEAAQGTTPVPQKQPSPQPGVTAPLGQGPSPSRPPGAPPVPVRRGPSRILQRSEGGSATQPTPGVGASPQPSPQSSPRPPVPTPTVRREPPAKLPPAPPPGSMVQMQFDNIELRDLIRFVSNIMGRNFVFDESVVKGKVTVLSPKSLTRDEVFRVFESVLNYQGFAIVQTPEAIKIVRAADAKGLAIQTVEQKGIGKGLPAERIATMVCGLEYLDSNTMVGILRPLMARDAYLVSVPATNSLIMIDTEANLQRLNQVIAEIDIPVSKQLSGIDVYNVQHTNASDLAKVLQSLLAEGKKTATPKEKIFITSYAPTNSLLVSAPPEDMKDIRRIIQEIDTFRPQVLVEAAIIEISVTDGQSLGVEWLTGKTQGEGGVVGGVINADGSLAALGTAILNDDASEAAAAAASAIGSGLNIAVFGGSITWNGKKYPGIGAFVKAVSTQDNVNILSTPQILTMNNEEAEIVVGENRPYLTSSRLDSAGNPINSFDYRDVGVKLKVKPAINKDGLVYLTLYQEVTQVTQATVGSGVNVQPAPTTLKRSTKTTVGVKDAQTIVISGLIRDDSTANRSGIPFLRSVPLLGWLFGSRSTTSQKTNLLVFITPRIVYTADALQELSDQKKAEQGKLLRKDVP